MTVRRKIFLTLVAFIVAMGLMFILLTLVIVMGIIHGVIDKDISDAKLEDLSQAFIENYVAHGHSWAGVEQVHIGTASSVLLVTPGQREIVFEKDGSDLPIHFGLKSTIEHDGEEIGTLYYIDKEVEYLTKLRYGISSSVVTLLLFGAVVLVLVSLVVAAFLSKRLTAPLRQLIAPIDQLGKGEYGVQAPIVSKDEYGKIAEAFNKMSTQLARAEALRKDLVADVAHELRTPITIIQGKLDLLQQSGRTVQPEKLLPVQDELIRLMRLIEDLFQLSLAEAKKLPLQKKETNLPKLVQKVVEHVELEASEKNIEVNQSFDSESLTVTIDPNRFSQVLLNLLTNALRHTPPGGKITVGAKETQFNSIRLIISDTGEGVHPEHLPYLFDRFYRTDESRSRHSGGTGLGLAISKEIILAHGGTIKVESTLGKGTTFIIHLPL